VPLQLCTMTKYIISITSKLVYPLSFIAMTIWHSEKYCRIATPVGTLTAAMICLDLVVIW